VLCARLLRKPKPVSGFWKTGFPVFPVPLAGPVILGCFSAACCERLPSYGALKSVVYVPLRDRSSGTGAGKSGKTGFS